MNTKNIKTDSVSVEEEVTKSEVARREEAIQAFWLEKDIFNKSLSTPAGNEPKGDFVFYDGPPFATGLPHYGHILAGTIKDAVPRFWTMRGYRVRRKWGWDCHGLPLENLIEKKLGLATKRDIEEFGVKNFNEAARNTVMEYADDWKQIIPRMGRFVDMEDDYKTMDSTYTESVWWVFSELNKKGLVFEGFKSMHLCPRCGTTLSNFEVNQGYKDIKDIAVTVKLPLLDEADQPTDMSLLVWTTTPWTLPGNMAAAVNEEFDYVEVLVGAEKFILAKARLSQLGTEDYKVLREFKGRELVGRKYQPPFDYLERQELEKKDKAWTIYHADYVELGEEGTGAVHLAPAYGDDDMKLAQKHNVPIFHHVNESGHFKDFITDFAGQLVKPKDDDEAKVTHLDADIEILKALQEAGKIFRKENITHSYPHCWRCDTPLLNYATTSWFVDVPAIKDKLVSENSKVHWVPEHVGSNRFGKWLDGARDWAVSRQRYWGAPLPIWRNPVTKDYKVFGSLKELQEFVPQSGNQYFLMRHGESESNLERKISCEPSNNDPLTEKGREQVLKAATELPADIDLIIHSGFLRTKQTAELVAKSLGLAEESVVVDGRFGEVVMPKDYNGKTWSDYEALFPNWADRYTSDIEGFENRQHVQKRVGELMYELEAKYKDKKILLVGHGCTLFATESVVAGANPEEAKKILDKNGYFGNAEVKVVSFTVMPHNDNYVLDYHRPYIDDIELFETDGTRLERVPDVFDCWFESGSMPYAQHHYPFAFEQSFAQSDPSLTKSVLNRSKEVFEKEYFPANFISESIDQTRGWFYSTMVLGVALFDKSPFENVVTNGLVLAEDGRKMSKSLQNYPDPMELVARQGADSMRFYLLSSSIIKAEDLNFSEKEVQELQRKNIGRLHNVLAMYQLFADGSKAGDNSDNILDKWIVARLNELITDSTKGYQNYELDKATRPVTDFIDDLSVWYLRRSRDRVKGDDQSDKALALGTLRYVLRKLSLVMAPVMPFYAEYLWQAVREDSDAESVHLAAWPEAGLVDENLIEDMSVVRKIVTEALEVRTKAQIKVRQPLAELIINIDLKEDLLPIISDEVNVKKVTVDTSASEVRLDEVITPELKSEGDMRELIRALQDRRKAEGLMPQDQIKLTVATTSEGSDFITKFQSEIQSVVGVKEIVFSETEGQAVTAGEHSFVVNLEKL
ncbi:class I tRNA ligase family protein [Candidatus Kaiserbacteria bacterium]|nr:class I tRNA ligase family protein [Candidatus Kaiserbacteria bacterium]